MREVTLTESAARGLEEAEDAERRMNEAVIEYEFLREAKATIDRIEDAEKAIDKALVDCVDALYEALDVARKILTGSLESKDHDGE